MEKIILDCDPGHDDAIAILLAAGNPNIELLGITTVSGNHNVENTTRNALATCTAYGIKVPVAKGSPVPMLIDRCWPSRSTARPASMGLNCRPPRSSSTGGMPSISSSTPS